MDGESYVLLFNLVTNLINMQANIYDHIILFITILTIVLIGYITFTAWILNKKINQQKANS
jgi:phage-related minor tail protein